MIIDDDSSRPLLITAEDKDRRKKREPKTRLMCFQVFKFRHGKKRLKGAVSVKIVYF